MADFIEKQLAAFTADEEVIAGVMNWLKEDKNPQFPPDLEIMVRIVSRRIGKIHG